MHFMERVQNASSHHHMYVRPREKVMSTSWRPWLGNEENNTTPEHTEFPSTPRTDQDPATEMESQSQESRIKGIERVDQKLSR